MFPRRWRLRVDDETKETVFYDRDGKRTTPDKAVRAEIIHRTQAGTVVKVEYFEVESQKRP
jgi:hypothetical protein